ncbi:nuclear transport factor 2 family protein [Sphingobium lignivorans]|uniref:SnoaL-like domain-containing protein n=1 Tax=Sphingobium lignivorans TaxID=2735886 RepID=A0ABR6NHX2_9SPHN|nr:nuclear transport factor 2 family protein [Sphingobium lignivorans]MBB5986855.1 hypothetical protein [Sphingobium lignivorans]
MATDRAKRARAAIAALCLAVAPAAGHAAQPPVPLALALERTEAIRAVRDLQTLLAHHVEAGDWAAASALFTRDAALDWGNGTAAKGRAAIRDSLRTRLGGAESGGPNRLHATLPMAPVLTLSPDGRSAKGRWHEVGLFGGARREDNWTGGIHENDYVREADGWRIRRMAYHPQFRGTYAKGWHSAKDDLPVVPYHYEAASVGAPVTMTGAVDAEGPALAPRVLAARAARLADEDAVRNLQNIYGYYLDRRMWDDALDLFAPDGSHASAGTGLHRGREGIRAMLERDGPAGLNHGDLNDHVMLDLIVCVAPDGRSARARGFDFGMSGNNAGKAFWSLTLFDNLFEKQDGIWRLKAVREYPRMRTTHDASWDLPTQPRPLPARAADAPAPAEPPLLATCAPADPVPGDAPDMAQLRARVEAAAASIAIDNVSNAFANYIDDFRWQDLAATFTRDGRREAPGVGFYVGRERIHAMQSGRYGPLASPRTFIPIHARIQPVIHVAADGKSAKLRTRLLQFNAALDRPGSMMAGIYEDEARLEDGVWRLAHVEIDHYLQTRSYRDAWTRIPEGLGHRMIPRADALLRDNPPDAPLLGEIYAPFPTIGLMWFHYANPVSGRRPSYLTPKTAAVMSRTEEPLDP